MTTAHQPVLTPDQLPPPDTLYQYPDGSVVALMFHFMTEATDFALVAQAQGFDIATMRLDDDGAAAGLATEYEAGSADVIGKWQPRRDGYSLAAKFDTDDGPMAVFIKPRQCSAGQRNEDK
jgi:hypothetical protein